MRLRETRATMINIGDSSSELGPHVEASDRREHTSVTLERQTETSAPLRTPRKASLVDSRRLSRSVTLSLSVPRRPLLPRSFPRPSIARTLTLSLSCRASSDSHTIPLLSRSHSCLFPPSIVAVVPRSLHGSPHRSPYSPSPSAPCLTCRPPDALFHGRRRSLLSTDDLLCRSDQPDPFSNCSPVRTRYRVPSSAFPLPLALDPSRSKLPALCIVALDTRKFGHCALLLSFPLSLSLFTHAGWPHITMRFTVRNQRSTLATGRRSQKKGGQLAGGI